jgi:16S rRNA (guanine966-N2)-methyltransferase
MRIIGGKHRGRRLKAPRGSTTRPTAERAREALFNILAHADFADGAPAEMRVLDAFAGTGALGFEALSRGAAQATFLERNGAAAALIEENAAALGEAGNVAVLRRDATRPGPAPLAHDLALLDAPYRKGLTEPALRALAEAGWLGPGALVAAEIGRDETLDPPEGFSVIDERYYGAAAIIFLQYNG